MAGPSSARPARPRPLAEVLAELNFIFSAISASSAKVLSQLRQLYTYTLPLHPTPLPTTHYPLLTSAYHSIAEGQVMMTEDGLRRQWIL